MTRFSRSIAALTAALLIVSGQMATAETGIQIKDPYARVIGVSAKSGAVFMTILNDAPTDDRLLSVATDAATRAELHTHSEDANGVMRMGKVTDGFAIPGAQTHMLDRGGDHIMLLGLTKPLSPGDTITLTLTFAQQGAVTIKVPVDNDRAAAPVDHGAHGMPKAD